jgi:hypothetical protein
MWSGRSKCSKDDGSSSSFSTSSAGRFFASRSWSGLFRRFPRKSDPAASPDGERRHGSADRPSSGAAESRIWIDRVGSGSMPGARRFVEMGSAARRNGRRDRHCDRGVKRRLLGRCVALGLNEICDVHPKKSGPGRSGIAAPDQHDGSKVRAQKPPWPQKGIICVPRTWIVRKVILAPAFLDDMAAASAGRGDRRGSRQCARDARALGIAERGRPMKLLARPVPLHCVQNDNGCGPCLPNLWGCDDLRTSLSRDFSDP